MNDKTLRLFASLPQQAPGSPADSLAVLNHVRDRLGPSPRIADLGCGTGRASLWLAGQLPDARIIAVDAVDIFISELQQTIDGNGLSDRITAISGDMLSSVAEASLDLIWSEGAAYAVGFEQALRGWYPLLKPGGYCIVSECEWLTDDRPRAVSAFWARDYPAMADRQANIAMAQRAGFEPVAVHLLSDQGWRNYYSALERALDGGAGRGLPPGIVDGLREEIAIWRASGGSYGYVFYVLRAA